MKETFRDKILKLALPIMAQQFMLALVSACDAFMLGGLNQSSLSAVSLASQITFVFNLILTALTIGGIFPAGGDTKFGLKCDTVTMWCFAVPLGCIAAFVWKLPVLTVYFVLNLDELVKLPAVFRHYRKYKWLKNLTETEN